jgi:acyl-CoA reductase-like NAD-dependent aldehyde dehydrogenase
MAEAANGRMLIGGAWREGVERREIRSPWSGEVVLEVCIAGEREVEDAITTAVSGFEAMRRLPTFRRAELLLALRDGLVARREEFARSIALEVGKPITDARVEVDRGANVLTLAAEEAKRIGGEVMPLDLMPSSAGRFAITQRFPLGPITGISPYNFPLNLGLHKVGPALACGSAIIWKPSLLAPGAALLFAELAQEVGVPAGALNIVTPPDALAERLVTDPRIRMVSFTGSARVGWALRERAGHKRVVLELGGNAAVLIGADADLDYAVQRCVTGGFSYAGQVCISVQRILIERAVYETFVERLDAAVRELRTGDPLDERTQMGPMVSEKEAGRVEEWLREAVEGGADLLIGGQRNGLMFEPAVLAGVTAHMKLSYMEAFGPVVTVEPFDSWPNALASVNRSAYGLQAGVFTRDFPRIFQAFKTLEVGGLVVNDVPTYRMDSMPYGGVKESGLGREGVRFAIEEMTEVRMMAVNLGEER